VAQKWELISLGALNYPWMYMDGMGLWKFKLQTVYMLDMRNKSIYIRKKRNIAEICTT
jgi:hypothetical protein